MTDVDRTLAVARVSLFEDLRHIDGALIKLCNIMELRKLKSGDSLIIEGELGDEFFILVHGTVSIYQKTSDGDPYKVAILNGSMMPALGEGGLVTTEARTATVVCDNNCEFLVLSRQDFEQFATEHPEWAIPILKKIATMVIARLKAVNNDLMLLHRALMDEIRS